MAAGNKTKARATTAAHDEKRLDIIEHCARLFDKVGYHRATMQMLADEVGLGKPTLYYYFASKTDILFEMHQLHIDALIKGLADEAETVSDPGELLIRACAFTLREIAEHPGYVRAFMDHYADLEGQQRTDIRNRRQEYFGSITSIIKSGIDAGKFRDCDPEVATLAFLGMCNWAYKWYPRRADQNPPEEMARTLCQYFLDGLNRRD